MTTSLRYADMPTLVAALEAATAEVRQRFGELTPTQLNWKPDPAEWSVGQCLDHLIVSNRTYVPMINQVLEGTKTRTFWERLPLMPRLYASMLIRSLTPGAPRSVQAPKIFLPTSSAIDSTIIDTFVQNQQRLIELMQQCSRLSDLDRIIVTSPVASYITYSLLDAFRIITVHEQLHIDQAQRLMQMSHFPIGQPVVS